MKKKLKRKETLKLGLAILALLFFGGGLTVSGVVYVNSVDETVYQESVAHLTEIYRQSTDSLNKTVSRNWSAMDVWTYYLKEHSDENEVKEFLDSAQQAIHFTGFLFISEDNGIETRTLDGQEGRLLVPQETISSLLEDHEDIMANIPVAGQGQAMLFAVPCEGTFGTFQYDAIGAYFNSDDLISTITVNAFEGKASSLLIHKDGRIILEKSSGLLPPSHNLFATLRNSSLNEEQLKSLQESIKHDGSGNTSFRYAGKTYYLVFQNLDFEQWVVVGIVPADTVNSAMGKLQTSTILFVTAVTAVLVSVLSGVGLTLFRNSLKKKDAEIQYREELFSCLSTSVDDIFLMLSANSYAVQYVSPNVERLLGIPPSKVYESMKAISDLTVGNAPTIVEQIPSMRLDEQKEWDKEYFHAETKEIRWFHITAFFNRIEGEGKFILVLSDRTQTKLINQALEEALVNAQSASKAKSTFLSNMSHDIRTPMNAIIGFANLAGASVNDPKKTQDYLAKIQDSSNHLLAIINDVLDMSRIEAGKLAMERNEVYFPEVLRELRVIIGGQVKAKGLNLYMDTSTIEHEYVYCDKTRLNQMLMNLLSNAVKFTPSGGSISVSIAEEASNQPQTAIYHIRVKDDGIGMSEEFAARIFDPFERERTSTVSRTQGTGLGMSIVKNIVTLMGGTIEVSTHPGEGSEFHITVALELQNVEKPDETIESLKGLKAIAIHENPGSRQSAIAILRRLGMSPIAVASLQEGLELMEKAEEKGNPFTIALVNGDQKNEDAYSYWKKFSRLPSLKALIVGSYESEDIEKKAKEAGVSFIIPKPLFLSELQSALLDFLGERPSVEDIPQAKDLTMFRGKRLLLVEDNELNREIALATLEGYGFSFLTAENGKEAIEIVASSRPGEIDLILMDVQMPIMDGYEATERIRNLKDPVLSNIPIIAMTANAFAEDRQKAENAGMNGFLTKPIEVDKVIDLLTTILYRS